MSQVKIDSSFLYSPLLSLCPFALSVLLLFVFFVHSQHHVVIAASTGHIDHALHNHRLTLTSVSINKLFDGFNFLFYYNFCLLFNWQRFLQSLINVIAR